MVSPGSSSSNSSTASSRCPDSRRTVSAKPSAPTRWVYSTKVPYAFGPGHGVPERGQQVGLADAEAAVQVVAAGRRAPTLRNRPLRGGLAIRSANADSASTARLLTGLGRAPGGRSSNRTAANRGGGTRPADQLVGADDGIAVDRWITDTRGHTRATSAGPPHAHRVVRMGCASGHHARPTRSASPPAVRRRPATAAVLTALAGRAGRRRRRRRAGRALRLAGADRGRPVVRANMIASLDGGSTVDGRSAAWATRPDERPVRGAARPGRRHPGRLRHRPGRGVRRRPARCRAAGPAACAGACPPTAAADRRGHRPRPGPGARRCSPTPTRRRSSSPPKSPRTRFRPAPGDHRRPRSGELAAAVAALGSSRPPPDALRGRAGAARRSLLADDLLDECCLTIAPLLLGAGATPLVPVRLRDPRPLDAGRRDGRRQTTCSPGTGGRPTR